MHLLCIHVTSCSSLSILAASRAFIQRTTSCSDSIDSISLPIHCGKKLFNVISLEGLKASICSPGASPMKPRVMTTQTTMKSRAATEALQDCQGLLREQLKPEEVARELFSASLIDVDVVSRAQDQSIDVQQRAQELLSHILSKAESKPSCFNSICTILEKKEVPCVQRLRGIYCVCVYIEHLLIVLYVHLFAEKYDGQVKVQDITVVIVLSKLSLCTFSSCWSFRMPAVRTMGTLKPSSL